MDESSSASFLDKTDWRVTIHRKLEACVDAEDTEWYPRRVKSLVSAFAAEYPGWDAKFETLKNVSLITYKYDRMWELWLENNLTSRRWVKYNQRKKFYMDMYREIFEYIKNRCASKRMLLWGSKNIPGGSQMGD